MKTFLSWVCVAIFVSVAASAYAQSNVNVSARIVAALSIDQIQHMDFGPVLQGATSTIPTTDAARRGSFRITKSPGSAIDITVTYPANISNGANDLILLKDNTNYGSYFGDITTTAVSFNPQTGSYTNLFIPDATVTVYLGGQIETLVGTPVGEYTGVITVNAIYTAL